MTDFNLQSACSQRAKRMLFSYPTNRFDIISPYTDSSYTPLDLDMRRKAEILEYKGNAQAKKVIILRKTRSLYQCVRL